MVSSSGAEVEALMVIDLVILDAAGAALEGLLLVCLGLDRLEALAVPMQGFYRDYGVPPVLHVCRTMIDEESLSDATRSHEH